MGLETRGNGNFYYRKHRVGPRVVSEYVGGGLIAQLTATYDERGREKEWKERQAARALGGEEDALDAEINAVCELVGAYVSARLLADGYHRHHRGEWRLRRKDSGERKANSAGE